MKKSFADTQNIILKNEFLTFHSLYTDSFFLNKYSYKIIQ